MVGQWVTSVVGSVATLFAAPGGVCRIAPDLEFRHASKALGLERSGLSYQRIPPDYRFPYGHTHSLEILVFGAPNLGENPREDVEGQRDWWAD
jgi:hypothetical protein